MGSEENVRAKPGKYLTFKLSVEDYGLEILKVQEIIGLMSVTHVPKMPDYMRGIINLRGKLIPVVDMRKKFCLPDQKDTEKTCIIVVVVEVLSESTKITIGILVDSVSEVLSITGDQLEPPPAFGSKLNTEFMLGMGKVGNKVILLLDIDKILQQTEVTHVMSAASGR